MGKIYKKKGFSLVELSIVLIIVGLLIGGVSVGSKLVNRAKISSFISELEGYKTSIITFYITYEKLPGDFDQATIYWGNDAVTNGDGKLNNGNGDGEVNWTSHTSDTDHETADANLHLAKAELIPNVGYTGSIIGGRGHGKPFKDFDVDAMLIFYKGEWADQFLEEKNAIQVGMQPYAEVPFLKPSEAYSIDKKLDDGKPKEGVIRFSAYSLELGGSVIDASCTGTSQDYLISSNAIGCTVLVEVDIE